MIITCRPCQRPSPLLTTIWILNADGVCCARSHIGNICAVDRACAFCQQPLPAKRYRQFRHLRKSVPGVQRSSTAPRDVGRRSVALPPAHRNIQHHPGSCGSQQCDAMRQHGGLAGDNLQTTDSACVPTYLYSGTYDTCRLFITFYCTLPCVCSVHGNIPSVYTVKSAYLYKRRAG